MRPKIIAHRGDMENAPENTLAAFIGAKEKGVDAVEFDIHSTLDGFPVVHHDYTLERTTNGQGALSEQTVQYVQKLNAGSWFDEKFHTERVPLLEEVFALLGQSLQYEIEVRSCNEAFLKRVLGLVSKYNVKKKVEFTSPHAYVLTWLKQKANVQTGMVVSTPPDWLPTTVAQDIAINNALLGNVDVLHCSIALLSKSFVRQAHDHNLVVHAADCDTEEQLRQAMKLGLDQLSTSRLSLALEYVRKDPVNGPGRV